MDLLFPYFSILLPVVFFLHATAWFKMTFLFNFIQVRTPVAQCVKGLLPPTGRSWVQAPAAILARLGNKYLLKSLMMSTLHSASVLDKPP